MNTTRTRILGASWLGFMSSTHFPQGGYIRHEPSRARPAGHPNGQKELAAQLDRAGPSWTELGAKYVGIVQSLLAARHQTVRLLRGSAAACRPASCLTSASAYAGIWKHKFAANPPSSDLHDLGGRYVYAPVWSLTRVTPTVHSFCRSLWRGTGRRRRA